MTMMPSGQPLSRMTGEAKTLWNNNISLCNVFSLKLPAFEGAGRKVDATLADAAKNRQREAAQTADTLIQGRVSERDVYLPDAGHTMLDLASWGALRDYLGRQRRSWSGFADQAHALKARWGREYDAFCLDKAFSSVVQVVVRPPEPVFPLQFLRARHLKESARLGDRLRYGMQRTAENFECDIISAEVRSAAAEGSNIDLHFHLTARADARGCDAMRLYFEASGWTWWDSLSGGVRLDHRSPGALAQYSSKALADTIRRACAGPFAFSPENLAQLMRQTRCIAMTRAVGAFRRWRARLEKDGIAVRAGDSWRRTICRRIPSARDACLRDRLGDGHDLRLLCLTLHNFGDNVLRPAARVAGKEGVSFDELARVYDISEAVLAARDALITQETAAIPDTSLWRPAIRSGP
jgi:hypothetical protein